MKKTIYGILVLLCILAFTGCQKAYIPDNDNDKINIVCTTFPQYDWTKHLIAGMEEKYELRLLMNQGTDMHSYQPTAEDVVIITECDLLIYGGGESEEWVVDALKDAGAQAMHTVCLMEVIGSNVKDEVVVEGMQAEKEEETEASDAFEGDEHIWLSLDNAKLLASAIASALADMDSEHRQQYESNLDNYVNQLDELDQKYEETVANATYDTVIFGDRFPFLYMMEDYGINYYAAFSGCSAETEASFETITFLAEKLDEYGLPCVLMLENADGRLAQTIIDSSKDKTKTVANMHSMQSVTKKDIEKGVTYLGLMEQNLEALKQALY